jgi:signal transduction histidine kinase
MMNIEEITSELQTLKEEKYHLLKLINHDIRSPFNRIFALLQLFELDSGELTPQQEEYMNSMYLSILSGLEMIQNLRDMREIDAGNILISNDSIHLPEILKNAIRSFSKQMELKKIDVKIVSVADDVEIVSDGYYLQRVVENVLSNAIKFSKSGKEVLINAKCADGACLIEITDFGEGIKQNEAHMLFQKFKKLSSFATGGEGSLGLGLHNTRAIITMMSGNIFRNENVSQGASFVISIPTNPAIL